MARGDTIFRDIKTNKKISFYIQGQRIASRIFLIFWMLAIGILENTLSVPGLQEMPITINVIGDYHPLAMPLPIFLPGGELFLTYSTSFVERTVTDKLFYTLVQNRVCVLHGRTGTGKSTLAAYYGHACKETYLVYWFNAAEGKLQEYYQQLAQNLNVRYQSLDQQRAAYPKYYRQKLAKMVYDTLKESSKPILLILENADNASLVADYLLYKPTAIQVLITTHSAETFKDKYAQLPLGPFSQDEGKGYLEVLFKHMNCAYTSQEVDSLVEEVGRVPHKLELAAKYLQNNQQKTIAEYITFLRFFKADNSQQSNCTFPEVALSLEILTNAGQQLMHYIAYLDGDFIPLELLDVLLDKDYAAQCSQAVSELSNLSLVKKVFTTQGKMIGLQVHQEVQIFCRGYEGWRVEATGAKEAIWAKLVMVLTNNMPWVESVPNKDWQQARLYAPHVIKLGEALEALEVPYLALLSNLLMIMGKYMHEIVLDYYKAVQYYNLGLEIAQQIGNEVTKSSAIAIVLTNLANVLRVLGQAEQAKETYKKALERLEKDTYRLAQTNVLGHPENICLQLGDLQNLRVVERLPERALKNCQQPNNKNQDHLEIAKILNGIGATWLKLRNQTQALSCFNRALEEYYQGDIGTQNYPAVAHIWSNYGIAYLASEQPEQAQQCFRIASNIFKNNSYHPNAAVILNNLRNGSSRLRSAPTGK